MASWMALQPVQMALQKVADVSVITQFDGPLIDFDDGLQELLSVIGGGGAAKRRHSDRDRRGSSR